MCGLCGNFDGNEENDLRDAEGNEINCTERVTQNGRKKCGYPQLGNSWEVPDYDSLPGYGSYFNGLFALAETDCVQIPNPMVHCTMQNMYTWHRLRLGSLLSISV